MGSCPCCLNRCHHPVRDCECGKRHRECQCREKLEARLAATATAPAARQEPSPAVASRVDSKHDPAVPSLPDEETR